MNPDLKRTYVAIAPATFVLGENPNTGEDTGRQDTYMHMRRRRTYGREIEKDKRERDQERHERDRERHERDREGQKGERVKRRKTYCTQEMGKTPERRT